MHKTKMALFAAMIAAGALPLAACQAQGEQADATQNGAPVEQAQPDASQPQDGSQPQAAQPDGSQPQPDASQAPADAQGQPSALPHNAQEQNGGAQGNSADEVPGPQNDYEVKTFFADYKQYTIGDVVPDLYRSKPYNIADFKIRHLPAPQPGSHWTYMGGNYVLITDADGKILQAKAGEIFYHN